MKPNHLFVSLGEKGGVAKSFQLYGIIETLLHRDRSLSNAIECIDGDRSNHSLENFAKSTFPVAAFPLQDHDGWRSTGEHIGRSKARFLVIDTPANVWRHLVDCWHGYVAEQAHRTGRETLVFFAIDETLPSIAQLKAHLAHLPAIRLVVVMSGRFGTEDQFFAWRESRTRREFMAAGGREAYLPRLHNRVVVKLQRVGGPFSRALAPGFGARHPEIGWSPIDEVDLCAWLSKTRANFSPLLPH